MPALQTIEDTNAKVQELDIEVRDLRNEIAEIKTKLMSNTAITNQIKKDTADILELFHTFTTAMKFGMKFTLTMGKLIQWIAAVLIAVGVIYTTYYNLKFGVSLTSTPPSP